MKEKIRKHINGLFTEAPKTRKAMELKEEMIQNTIEKYEDLIAEGHKEEDAFRIVVGSIGDVTELFEDLKDKSLWPLALYLPNIAEDKAAVAFAAALITCLLPVLVYLNCQEELEQGIAASGVKQ